MTRTLPPRARRAAPRVWHPRAAAVASALLALALLPVLSQVIAAPDAPRPRGPQEQMQLASEAHTRRALAAGQLPLWNPYEFGGRPHLADPATLALYPPHVLLRPLPVPTFFAVSRALHAWVFGLGVYLLARQFRAARLASSLIAAIAMLGAAFSIGGGIGYAPWLYSIAWLPLLVVVAMRVAGQGPAVPRPASVAVFVMALTAPMGQLSALAAVAAGYVLVAIRGIDSTGRRPWAVRCATFLCLGVGLSAFQLAPYARLLAAGGWTGGQLRLTVGDAGNLQRTAPPDPGLTTALAALAGPRVLSDCENALDDADFASLGIPGVGGIGGIVSADYARFLALAGGGDLADFAARQRLPATPPFPRRDLAQLLGAPVAVTCSPPPANGARTVRPAGKFFIERDSAALPRAFWTCAPRRAGRQEIEYRLRNQRYDETLTLRDSRPVIQVRWTRDTDEPSRGRTEALLRMRPRQFVEDRTWQYELADPSRENLAAIVRHPAVEDTAGFDRGGLALPDPAQTPSFDERRSEWLIGADACEDPRPAVVERLDGADGHLAVTVDAPRDGVVFFSETYSPDRIAHVDGNRVDALNVNLAFTAVPVAAGAHRVELRADPVATWVGFAVTALAAGAWGIAARRAKQRT